MNQNDLFIGIDPDLHCLPVVTVNGAGEVVAIAVIKPKKKLKAQAAVIEMVLSMESIAVMCCVPNVYRAVAVESQEIAYSARSGKNPRSLCLLANISGASIAVSRAFFGFLDSYLPTPQQWKGSVPKEIHHARIFKKLGWPYAKAAGYCYPTNFNIPNVYGKINKGDWKHITDAIGLALWARDKYYSENR